MLSFPLLIMLALHADVSANIGMVALTSWMCKPKSGRFTRCECRIEGNRDPSRGHRPDTVGGGQARRRLVDHREPGAADARPCRAGHPRPDREGDARTRLRAEPGGGGA